VTVLVSGTITPASERLAIAARAIQPILNRVVLAGPPVTDLLINDPAVRTPQLTFAADSVLQLLSTSMVDRLGLELQKLGATRIGRTERADRWRVADDVTLDLIQVRTDDADADPGQLCLEYATLLTLPFTVDDQLTVRIAAAPPTLALECASFVKSRVPALESEELERVVLLIAARKEIEKECAAAPLELRSIIAAALAELVRGDALPLLIQRALPDAALLPALGTRVRERILRIVR
jgi:hypothetical protein